MDETPMPSSVELTHIAVIMPCYNCADALHQAVSSIITSAQYARNYMGLSLYTEIIAVDDGSQDATADAIRDIENGLQLKHVTFTGVYNLPNRGAGLARNEGVDRTNADIIFFLDVDDAFLPPHLGMCTKALLDNPHLGYVWTQRELGIDVHPSWSESLDASVVMNLGIRKIWHNRIKGFPRHPDFRKQGGEDSFYRAMLRITVSGALIPEKTVDITVSPGNSLDRQKDKFSMPQEEWLEMKEPSVVTDGMRAEAAELISHLEQYKAALTVEN